MAYQPKPVQSLTKSLPAERNENDSADQATSPPRFCINWIACFEQRHTQMAPLPNPFQSLSLTEHVPVPTVKDDIPDVAQSFPPKVAVASIIPTKLLNLPPKPKRGRGEEILEAGYQPKHVDIICSRDRYTMFHEGNVRLRNLADARVAQYMSVEGRAGRSAVIAEIFNVVRLSGGRFIRPQAAKHAPASTHVVATDTDQHNPNDVLHRVYVDIGKKKAIEKIGKAIRSAMQARQFESRRKSWTAGCISAEERDTAVSKNITSLVDASKAQNGNEQATTFSLLEHDWKPEESTCNNSDQMTATANVFGGLLPSSVARRQTWNGASSSSVEELARSACWLENNSNCILRSEQAQEWYDYNQFDDLNGGLDALSGTSMPSEEGSQLLLRDDEEGVELSHNNDLCLDDLFL